MQFSEADMKHMLNLYRRMHASLETIAKHPDTLENETPEMRRIMKAGAYDGLVEVAQTALNDIEKMVADKKAAKGSEGPNPF